MVALDHTRFYKLRVHRCVLSSVLSPTRDQSGSSYEGDFFLGVFHGRGRFKSANLNVSNADLFIVENNVLLNSVEGCGLFCRQVLQ